MVEGSACNPEAQAAAGALEAQARDLLTMLAAAQDIAHHKVSVAAGFSRSSLSDVIRGAQKSLPLAAFARYAWALGVEIELVAHPLGRSSDS